MNELGFYGNRGLLVLKKHSPEILTGLGITASIGGAVATGIATYKAAPIIEQLNVDIQDVKEDKEIYESKKSYTKELIKTYAGGASKLAALYAPAVALELVSAGCAIGSNRIYSNRVANLSAAYCSLATAYGLYRKKIKDKFGKEEDVAARINGDVVEESSNDGEKKKTVYVDGYGEVSEYSRFFGPGYSSQAYNDNEYNKSFVLGIQKYANDLLRSRGHLFLNEVYDALGFEHTKSGSVVGWIYDPNNPEGDNYVDFGITNIKIRPNMEFCNLQEEVVLLDFNVDGVIYDLI